MDKIKELIVVEGKTDIDFLSSFLNADFYQVNGSAVNGEDVLFLKKFKEQRDIIVLTDPDFPGKRIRNYLNQQIDGLKNAFVDKSVSIKNNKVGVAESTKEEVLRALSNCITYEKDAKNTTFSMHVLHELGLTGSETSKFQREKLGKKLQIGYHNAKSLMKILNLLNIKIEEVEEILNA